MKVNENANILSSNTNNNQELGRLLTLEVQLGKIMCLDFNI
jgi:hypothetical protein